MFSILLCVAIHYITYFMFFRENKILLLIDGNAYKIIDQTVNKFDVEI
jgi:hypothetical protein